MQMNHLCALVVILLSEICTWQSEKSSGLGARQAWVPISAVLTEPVGRFFKLSEPALSHL